MPNFAILAAIFVIVMLPSRDAHAYLDPGTGSFVLQMLAATVLGAMFTAKMWIGTAKQYLARLFGSARKPTTPPEPPPAQ